MVGGYRTERPMSTDEMAALLAGDGPFFVTGTGSKEAFALPTAYSDVQQVKALEDLGSRGLSLTAAARSLLMSRHPTAQDQCEWTRISTEGLMGIVEHDAADQVVVVRAGTHLENLQDELKTKGQCLPFASSAEVGSLAAGLPGTIGGMISMNLPHALEAQCGSWREWVLGMTIARPDGSVAKAGSKAVKNVAGYDVQKLFIGSRGTLGVITEVVLRTFPVGALPKPECKLRKEWSGQSLWIQRTLPTDFQRATDAGGIGMIAEDPATSTLWSAVPSDSELPRWPDDWVIRAGAGQENLTFDEPTTALMRKAKDAFDPSHKLNPGELGIF